MVENMYYFTKHKKMIDTGDSGHPKKALLLSGKQTKSGCRPVVLFTGKQRLDFRLKNLQNTVRQFAGSEPAFLI